MLPKRTPLVCKAGSHSIPGANSRPIVGPFFFGLLDSLADILKLQKTKLAESFASFLLGKLKVYLSKRSSSKCCSSDLWW